ncbi:hypothetical protein quinque_010156 [Culex quinquefasciatus]
MAEHVEMQIVHIREPLVRVESIPLKFDFKKWREHKKDTEEVCQNGFARVLKLFLANIKSRIECKHPLLLTSLRELRKSRTQVRLDCFKQLLNDRRIMAYVCGDQNQTALHYAIHHGMDQEAKEIMLKKAPYLWKLNNLHESPLHSMKADILEVFLDSKISIPQESKEIQLAPSCCSQTTHLKINLKIRRKTPPPKTISTISSTLQGSLVKPLVMMIGELDASEIEFNGHKLSYIMFICFVFFVTLVVANLINGVAVSDITEIRQQAPGGSSANRVEMLRRFEKCLSTNPDNQAVLTRKKASLQLKRPNKTKNPWNANLTQWDRWRAISPPWQFDEDTVNDAKNIAIRNHNRPLLRWMRFRAQPAAAEDRIGRKRRARGTQGRARGDGGHGTEHGRGSRLSGRARSHGHDNR